MPWPVAWLGLFLLCVYQGGLFALLLWAVRRGEDRLGLAPLWTLTVAYPAVEFFYPLLFPYSIGASQYRFSAITQIVEVTGLLGLTALIGLVNGAVYELVDASLGRRRPAAWRLAVPAALFVLALAYGLVRIPRSTASPPPQPGSRLRWCRRTWGPGTRVPTPSSSSGSTRTCPGRRSPPIRTSISSSGPRRPTIAGFPGPGEHARGGYTGARSSDDLGARTYRRRPDGGADTFNTALLTSASGDVLGSYDKIELLLFGERIPLANTFPEIRRWFPRSSTFTSGESLEPLRLGALTFLPTICYEDILPALVRRLWRSGGPTSVLINLTNDSWFGDSHEPMIHLALASFRAIETRRALIRSTNTGISALVDPVGRITARSGQWRREVVVGDVPVIERGDSTVYMRVGDIVGWLACGGVLLGVVAARRARDRVVGPRGGSVLPRPRRPMVPVEMRSPTPLAGPVADALPGRRHHGLPRSSNSSATSLRDLTSTG